MLGGDALILSLLCPIAIIFWSNKLLSSAALKLLSCMFCSEFSRYAGCLFRLALTLQMTHIIIAPAIIAIQTNAEITTTIIIIVSLSELELVLEPVVVFVTVFAFATTENDE